MGLRSPVGPPLSPTLGTRLRTLRAAAFPFPRGGSFTPAQGLTPQSLPAQRLPPPSTADTLLRVYNSHNTKMEQYFVANRFGVGTLSSQLVWLQLFPFGGWQGLGGQSLAQGGTRAGRL